MCNIISYQDLIMAVGDSNTADNSQFISVSTNPAFCIKLDDVFLRLDAPLATRFG
jgi:hypothetical protein